ncbi:MAG: toll/interleukin-1 receptor domain-containing protein [Myxococcota bacterium]
MMVEEGGRSVVVLAANEEDAERVSGWLRSALPELKVRLQLAAFMTSFEFGEAFLVAWSNALSSMPDRKAIESAAVAAWAENRLLLVALDDTPLPLGLADLPVVPVGASGHDLASGLDTLLASPSPDPVTDGFVAPGPLPTSVGTRKASRRSGGWASLLLVLGLLLGIAGLAVFFALPSGPGLSAPPPWVSGLLVGLALGLGITLGVVGTLMMRPFATPPHRLTAPPVTLPAPALGAKRSAFVSYAHQDRTLVDPIVAGLVKTSVEPWMDKRIQAGTQWAGAIVDALQRAEIVLVFCSVHAYASNHVKREVYLADRYGKPLIPVLLDTSEPPADFAYFFATQQHIAVHDVTDPVATVVAALA